LGTAAVGAGALPLAGLVLKTLKAGDEIGDTADKLGIGATALQELRYGARAVRRRGRLPRQAALDKMAITVGKFKAAKGKGGGGGAFDSRPAAAREPAAKAAAAEPRGGPVQAHRPQREDAGGSQARGATQEDRRRAADAQDALQTARRWATAIFGKGAKEIIPFVEEGSAGIDGFRRDAHKFGGVLSAEGDQECRPRRQGDARRRDGVRRRDQHAWRRAAADGDAASFREFAGYVAIEPRRKSRKWAENAAKWIETQAGSQPSRSSAARRSPSGERVLGPGRGRREAGGRLRPNLATVALVGLRLLPVAGHHACSKISGGDLQGGDALFKLSDALEGGRGCARRLSAGGGAASVARQRFSARRCWPSAGWRRCYAIGTFDRRTTSGCPNSDRQVRARRRAATMSHEQALLDVERNDGAPGERVQRDILRARGRCRALQASWAHHRPPRRNAIYVGADHPGAPIQVNVNVGLDVDKARASKALRQAEKDVARRDRQVATPNRRPNLLCRVRTTPPAAATPGTRSRIARSAR
jgi:hypothetical protein